MRATDGLQTTIALGHVKDNGQVLSLELSLEISMPVPKQDEHSPTKSKHAFIRPVLKCSVGSSKS